MNTANGLSQSARRAVALRPSAPWLLLTAGLVGAALARQRVGLSAQAWLVIAVVTAGSVTLGAGWQEARRVLHVRRHQRRMDTAHGLLNAQTGLAGQAVRLHRSDLTRPQEWAAAEDRPAAVHPDHDRMRAAAGMAVAQVEPGRRVAVTEPAGSPSERAVAVVTGSATAGSESELRLAATAERAARQPTPETGMTGTAEPAARQPTPETETTATAEPAARQPTPETETTATAEPAARQPTPETETTATAESATTTHPTPGPAVAVAVAELATVESTPDPRITMSEPALLERGQELAVVEPAALEEVTGTLRELGALVEDFGRKLDGLLREVHAETAPVPTRSRRT